MIGSSVKLTVGIEASGAFAEAIIASCEAQPQPFPRATVRACQEAAISQPATLERARGPCVCREFPLHPSVYA